MVANYLNVLRYVVLNATFTAKCQANVSRIPLCLPFPHMNPISKYSSVMCCELQVLS